MSVREDDLIAYHLDELSWWKRQQVRRALERDGALAAQSEEIAATLRAYCCEPVPVISDEMMERSWQRVRGSLGVLDPRPRRHVWAWTGAGIAVAAAVLLVAVGLPSAKTGAAPSPVTTASNTTTAAPSWSGRLLQELHLRKKPQQFNGRPGPLTTTPSDAIAADPQLATHLDQAERVLTEVSHTDGPLDNETREQVHGLLLSNAMYYAKAEQHGDLATASVIEDLGRVLTLLDAEPQHVIRKQTQHDPDAFRMEMSVGGVLLDLRILHDTPRNGGQ